AAHIMAREIPVVPAVYSTTVPPGGSLPSVAARSTMARATRSFMLPVGLADSSFAMMRADPAGTTRRSSTHGVLPMASRTYTDVLIPAQSVVNDHRKHHLDLRFKRFWGRCLTA